MSALGRLLRSGIEDGRGACKFACRYCFAADPDYRPGQGHEEPASDDILGPGEPTAQVPDEPSADVLMVAVDTELFHSPGRVLLELRRMADQGRNLTFATKMNLSDRTLDRLVDIQHRLAERRRVLSVMVSIPLWARSPEIEQRVPPVQVRVTLVRRLADRGLFPFVGIRPLLPPPLLSDSDVDRIVSATVDHAEGYITGPYWFTRDVFGLAASGLVIVRRPVPWMPGEPVWSVYEDVDRDRRFQGRIRELGGRHFERSADVVRAVQRREWGQA